MKKTYVLDTNVLIQSPRALFLFEDNDIVLPVIVLEELDALKSGEGEAGANARQAIRFLETFRLQGNLTKGVELPGGGTIRLELNHKDIPLHNSYSGDRHDNRILKVCLGLMKEEKRTILVTKDIIVRIKAQTLGIPAEDFTNEQVSQLEQQYTGRITVYAPDDRMEEFKKEGLPPSALYLVNPEDPSKKIQPEFVRNQFVTIKSDMSEKKTMLGQYNGKLVTPLLYSKKNPYGVSPRSAGQYFFQEALLSPAETTPLVIVKGAAGTAKTFYSLACGLYHMMDCEERGYRRIMVTRPNSQFDDDIGFLPGNEQEKIAPMMRPIIDNLELLVDKDDKQRYEDERELSGKIEELFDRGYIVTEAMNYIRGRSITQTYLIIDEAQNLTPRQVKGIITRAGRGTKIVIIGDPEQIDHPLLDERTNGLSYAAEKMKGSALCSQLTMEAEECERSVLAMDAAMRL